MVVGHEQLYPAGWMTQRRSTRPHLQRYYLLQRYVNRADAERLGWIRPGAVCPAGCAPRDCAQLIWQ